MISPVADRNSPRLGLRINWSVLTRSPCAQPKFCFPTPQLRRSYLIITDRFFGRRGDALLRLSGYEFASNYRWCAVAAGAVRIHHAFLIFPLPQLIIATAFAFLWNDQRRAFARRVTPSMTAISLFILFATQVYTIARTEKLITETGGRGRWSNALDRFCADNTDRSDVVIASLDWGFNEQLAFLTDAPQLVEPFWAFPAYKGNLPPLPPRSHYIYLVHSPEYSLFWYDVSYLQELQSSGQNVDIQPYSDRQGQIVFYTIRFRE